MTITDTGVPSFVAPSRKWILDSGYFYLEYLFIVRYEADLKLLLVTCVKQHFIAFQTNPTIVCCQPSNEISYRLFHSISFHKEPPDYISNKYSRCRIKMLQYWNWIEHRPVYELIPAWLINIPVLD